MKTLAIGRTASGAYWVFEFATWEEALVFIDTANNTPLPNHEAFEINWDLVQVNTTTVAEAITELKDPMI
jgi:hypothetical protein